MSKLKGRQSGDTEGNNRVGRAPVVSDALKVVCEQSNAPGTREARGRRQASLAVSFLSGYLEKHRTVERRIDTDVREKNACRLNAGGRTPSGEDKL